MIPSAINITQDNIISGATLFSINNPLVFLIDVDYTGTVSDYIFAEIYDGANDLLSENIIAPAYKDLSATKRQYIFISDQLLRGFNASIQEWTQTVNTLSTDPNSNTFKIKFIAVDTETSNDSISDELTFNTIQGSAQFGNSPSRVGIYLNAADTYIGYYGFAGFAYFYNTATASLKLTAGTGTSFAAGLIRAKVGLNLGSNTIPLYVNGTLTYTKTIDCRQFCTGQKLIKYMDRNGMFRLYAFNEFYQEKINAKELGRTSKLITSILTDQSNSLSIGKSVEKFIDLTADATASDLLLLEDLFCSPLIFMYIGTNGDAPADWLNMKIMDGDFISRIKKGNLAKVNITLEYPEQYSIKRF